MRCPPIPHDEEERLASLLDYGFGDERPLPDLDPVARIAVRIFRMPIAAVNMIGSDHVFFAASVGTDDDMDKARDVSFCAHAITQDDVMVVLDALKDERFHDNPLVTGKHAVRFYAGVPLRSLAGRALGVLCIIDTRPHRHFAPEDRKRLRELARMASDRLELRRVEVAGIREEATRAHEAAAAASVPDQMELSRLAKIDPLTGLPNRKQFYCNVEAILLAAEPSAVIMLDLDGFKDVNNILGPATGDEILHSVAARLKCAAGENCTVARVGGDEFAILACPVQEEEARQLASRALAQVAEPIPVGGQDVRISASCGIALSPRHAQEAVELIGNADLALYQAKMGGSGRSSMYAKEFRAEAAERRVYGMELHRAVTNGELLLFYQPQIRLSDNTVAGAEALIRWLHPTRGLLPPAAFLPALEAGPLATVVGAWVIDEASAQAARWIRRGATDFRMAVNLFGVQLRSGDLPKTVTETLARHGLPLHALEIEITENIVLTRDDAVLDALHRLRDMGVQVAFDDFGTGYASLSLLTQYPLTRIKIDRSFVQNMLQSPRDASIISAIVDMARALGLETTAEGIETEAQRDYLKAQHCTDGQGYLFGKPMPAAAFENIFCHYPEPPRRAATG